jgi:NADP-dependent alcohol dehydrogenase
VLGKTGNDDVLAQGAIEGITALFHTMGAATRLSDYGVDASAIRALVTMLEKHGRYHCGEHHDINPQQMGEILAL